MVNLLRTANVSDWTLLIRLKAYLPPGYIVKFVNNNNEEILSYKSNGSLGVDSYFAKDEVIFRSSNITTKFNCIPSLGNYSIYWIYTEDLNNDFDKISELANEFKEASSKEILDFIISDTFSKIEPSIRNQINGIIGAGNSMYPSETLQGLYTNLAHRFRERSKELNRVINHPIFKIFLFFIAKEIIEKNISIRNKE